MLFKVLTYNNISSRGLERLPKDRYQVAAHVKDPDAIMLRSADLHDVAIAESVKAVGRAGAGTNNVPVKALSKAKKVVSRLPWESNIRTSG